MLEFLPQIQKNLANRNTVNAKAAKDLFSIWRTGENKVENKIYKRPSTVSLEDIKLMQTEGLIKCIGERLEVTEKGSKVLKTMILGDDRSIFEDKGNIIEYNQALNTTKNIKTAKNKKQGLPDNWWGRFL